jgi:hypothetical protein
MAAKTPAALHTLQQCFEELRFTGCIDQDAGFVIALTIDVGDHRLVAAFRESFGLLT